VVEMECAEMTTGRKNGRGWMRTAGKGAGGTAREREGARAGRGCDGGGMGRKGADGEGLTFKNTTLSGSACRNTLIPLAVQNRAG
jgi:hypothetical protein